MFESSRLRYQVKKMQKQAQEKSFRTIRYLKIQFKGELKLSEVPAFRGAIINKTDYKHLLFHHHIDDDQVLYKYPRIQYKTIYKAPVLLCLQDGVDDIHHLFQKKDWEIQINGRPLKLEIDTMDLRNFNLQTWDKGIKYSIRNWIPLNQKNFPVFKESNEAEQKEMLERILKGNILSFAKGMDWMIQDELKVQITKLEGPFRLMLKGKSLLGFSAEFTTNAGLPNYIGLGKSASHGFGVIKLEGSRKKEEAETP